MKRFFIILILIFSFSSPAFTRVIDYDLLYYKAEMANVKLMHNLDPFQDEEYHKYAWAPYPLFRTSSTLYFKQIVITPGYYLLTPRKFKGRDYVLFKAGGKVVHIVPVVRKVATPMDFYKKKIPIPKKTKWQKFKDKVKNGFYKIFKDSKKTPPPKTFIDTKHDGRYFIIKLYFGEDCYIMAFRRNR